jgi:hypothetical protein
MDQTRKIPLLSALGFAIALFTTILTPIHSSACQPIEKRSFIDDFLTPRRAIPVSLLGVNAFVNDPRFGSIRSQFREVKSTLGIQHVRILFAWNDQVQPTPNSQPFFGFYDEIVRSLPPGVNALVVVTGVPSWMNTPANWIDGNPRKTFVEKWIRPVVTRYRSQSAISAWQIWNEPNNPSFKENVTLDVLTKPENYVELIALASTVSKQIAPLKRVVNGATTAIAQNFPGTLRYNQAMVSAGLLSFVDVFGVHYYGKSAERVVAPGGVGDFLKSIQKPMWLTEIGKQGTTSQLEYAQRYIPFLVKTAPRIQRVYLYQFTEATAAHVTYGLKNLTPGRLVSDLYVFLRDRVKGRPAANRKRS